MNLDALNNISPSGSSDGVNVDDVNGYVPQDLSPDQQQMFMDRQNAVPATGRLGVMDYYPTMNQPVNVGGYSGSVIGSTTLFAPGGAVVPMGMLDAREKAIQDAALMKAKEVDAFRQQFKAPTSKLVNINDQLREQYFGFMDSSWKKALQKAGGNASQATAILKNDPNFAAREKSYQDLAKYGDAIVGKIATDDEDIKTGRFTPTPSYMALKQKMLTSLDPSHPDFKNLGNTFRQMKVERDFADAYNDVTKNMVAQQLGYAGDVNSSDFIKVYEKTIKEWSPEQKAAVVDQMKNFYHGNDYFTPEKITKDVNSMMSGKWETKKLDVKERREPNDGAGYTYTDNDISKEPSSTNVFTSRGQGLKPGQGEMIGVYGVTHKKPIPAVIPTGRTMFINDEKNGLIKTNEVNPNSQIKLFKTEIIKVYDASKYKGLKDERAQGAYKNDGTPLSEEQIKNGVPFRYKTVSKGVMTDPDGTEKQFIIPAEEVETSLVKTRDKNGRVTSGVPVDKQYEQERALNEQLKKQGSSSVKTTSQPTKKSISSSEIASRAKAAGYTTEEYTKLLKQKGIEIK